MSDDNILQFPKNDSAKDRMELNKTMEGIENYTQYIADMLVDKFREDGLNVDDEMFALDMTVAINMMAGGFCRQEKIDHFAIPILDTMGEEIAGLIDFDIEFEEDEDNDTD